MCFTGRVTDLKARIEELRRIKASVNNELRDLESKRQKLHAEISGYNTHIETLKSAYEATNLEFQKLKVTIENTRIEQEELIRRNMPQVEAPHRILPPLINYVNELPGSPASCCMHSCFDFSRCSLFSQFPVYLYNPEEFHFSSTPLDAFIKSSVTQALDASPYMTYDPSIACLYVVLIGDVQGGLQNVTGLQERLKALPHWHGDGSNHLLINVARHPTNRDVFSGVNTGRAMIMQSPFTEWQMRRGFDIVAPPSLGSAQGDVWFDLLPIVPARRKFLASFQGELSLSHTRASHPRALLSAFNASGPHQQPSSEMEMLLQLENTIVETLKRMELNFPADNFLFEFSCKASPAAGVHGEWALCGSAEARAEMLKHSTFSLILAPVNHSVISTTVTQIRIYEALKLGAIPVLLGQQTQLPLGELLGGSAQRVMLQLPKQRASELHIVLRSLPDMDLLEMRRQGRVLWETFLGTTQRIMDSTLALLRARLGIPSFPVREEPSPSVFNSSFVPIVEPVADPEPEGEGDILGET